MTYTEQEQQKRNDLTLVAWNEWKDKCSVALCSRDNSGILTNEISKAFNRELIKALRIEGIMVPGESEASWRKTGIDCVQEFDCAIIEADTERANKQTGAPRKRKQWKNVVWLKMETSQDAPLKVLRGQLTGPSSFMRDVVRECVGREYQKNTCSLDVSVGDGDGDGEGATLGDRLPDPSSTIDQYLEPSQLTNEEQSQLEASLDAAFTLPDMALVLANVCRATVTEPQLLAWLGLGPSAAYDWQKQALKKLKTWFRDWGASRQDVVLSAAVLQHFFSRLSAENLPKALLYLLDPQKG